MTLEHLNWVLNKASIRAFNWARAWANTKTWIDTENEAAIDATSSWSEIQPPWKHGKDWLNNWVYILFDNGMAFSFLINFRALFQYLRSYTLSFIEEIIITIELPFIETGLATATCTLNIETVFFEISKVKSKFLWFIEESLYIEGCSCNVNIENVIFNLIGDLRAHLLKLLNVNCVTINDRLIFNLVNCWLNMRVWGVHIFNRIINYQL